MKIIIYSFDRDEMDLYAHYAKAQLGVWVTKCYDHFTLQRELAGGSCVVIIRTSVKSNAANATASLIAKLRKVREFQNLPALPVILVDQGRSINFGVGADAIIRGMHPMGDFIDAILEVTGGEKAA